MEGGERKETVSSKNSLLLTRRRPKTPLQQILPGESRVDTQYIVPYQSCAGKNENLHACWELGKESITRTMFSI